MKTIGKCIGAFAGSISVFEIIGAIITSVYFFDEGDTEIGLIFLLVVPILAIFNMLLFLGIANLIDNVQEIKDTICIEKNTNEIKINNEENQIVKKERVVKSDGYLVFECPNCAEELTVLNGTKEIECPYCNETIKVNEL